MQGVIIPVIWIRMFIGLVIYEARGESANADRLVVCRRIVLCSVNAEPVLHCKRREDAVNAAEQKDTRRIAMHRE